MLVLDASKTSAIRPAPNVSGVLDRISKDWLRQTVEEIAIPRHYLAQPRNNRAVAKRIQDQLHTFGYATDWQGDFQNLLTIPLDDRRPIVIVGAHYDSVPETPGADDNASAVAAMLGCAKAVARFADKTRICFVAFNREEDDLAGSTDFVRNYIAPRKLRVAAVNVLEMVGYCDTRPRTQKLPKGLPTMFVRDRGDFVAILGNRRSTRLVDTVLRCGKGYLPELPVLGLKIHFGLERYFRDFRRSDHAPFWAQGIPALMWTDTANFRNPHYHQPSDKPDTLDYNFLTDVTRLLTASVLIEAHRAGQIRPAR